MGRGYPSYQLVDGPPFIVWAHSPTASSTIVTTSILVLLADSVEELLREIAMNDLAPLMPSVKKKKGEKVDLALMKTAATTTTMTTTMPR